jgi:hypothetical protein
MTIATNIAQGSTIMGRESHNDGEERGESRAFTRVPFHHRVRLAGKNAPCAAAVFEVSRGGLSMSMRTYVRPGSIVRVTFEDITYGATPVEFDARVAWCEAQDGSSGTEFHAGVNTLHGDPETLAAMSEIFYTALMRLSARSRGSAAAQPSPSLAC